MSDRNRIARAEDGGVVVDPCVQHAPVRHYKGVVFRRKRDPVVESGDAADHGLGNVHAREIRVVFLRWVRRFLRVNKREKGGGS